MIYSKMLNLTIRDHEFELGSPLLQLKNYIISISLVEVTERSYNFDSCCLPLLVDATDTKTEQTRKTVVQKH
jgi:hypothetical protein